MNRKAKKTKASISSKDDIQQLSIFDFLDNLSTESLNEIVENNSNDSNITIAQDANTEEKSNDNEVEKIIKNADSNAEISNLPPKLKLPQTYEEIVKFIDKDLAKISELIIPVTQFEKEVNQVVNDIEYSGYLLFLYGLPGVGKSTFVSSLEWRKHIPIKTIFSIDTRKLSVDEPKLKLKKLLDKINDVTENFFKESVNQPDQEKLCIVIDYLENLYDEDRQQVLGFFRDLNGLLREYPILIVWPVTSMEDLKSMQDSADRVSSTIFHRRIPIIEFTGPPVHQYPDIAKKTILFFNQGKNCYDFQLNDTDFEDIKIEFEKKHPSSHIIRDYLKQVRNLWEERTNYVSELMKNIPKPTEVWFMFCYPEAENTIARFAKQSPDILEEMWNVDYKGLSPYITQHNQRKAEWPVRRLTLALNGILTTKIMYLPTNALISCIASYAEDAQIPISRQSFIQEYQVPEHWFGRKKVYDMLTRTPLYLQLSNRSISSGKRKSGTVEEALRNAEQAFRKININITTKDTTKQKKISDQRFNKAFYLALVDAFTLDGQSNVKFYCEKEHPLLNIRPDILVDIPDEKYICIELSYTVDKKPSYIADYVLKKLDKYMIQLQEQLGLTQDFWKY